ncbi:hypothetical protein LUTEI9C_70472 [Luteimonas sp. 9C]|nr:hypothetical protein LUTEI9C_70472 [Luteimonas sp. 9C]
MGSSICVDAKLWELATTQGAERRLVRWGPANTRESSWPGGSERGEPGDRYPRQQTRAAAVGDAGAGRRLRRRSLAEASDGAEAGEAQDTRHGHLKAGHGTRGSMPGRTGSKRSDRPEESLTNKVAPSHDTAYPRAWAKPMNERGRRVRFFTLVRIATPIQQDRLRKCSLAALESPNHYGEWHAARSKTKEQRTTEAQGKDIMHSGLTGSSLRMLGANWKHTPR